MPQYPVLEFRSESSKSSDDASGDFTVNEDGKLVANSEHIQRSRLRVDARKWIAAKLLPKRNAVSGWH